jgi:2-dehydro-3-deoxygalactonokinase
VRYVAGDWGTSRLRLWLVADARIADRCEGPGIAALAELSPDARRAALGALIRRWHRDGRAPEVRLAGMAGARNGLAEVPYVGVPADGATWARAAQRIDIGALGVTIAAGLAQGAGDAPPDVMRGEETQVFGALELEPALARGAHVVVLPGTHSKWVALEDGCIRRFRTCMTGELFALLAWRSSLLATGGAPVQDDAAGRRAGFEAGLARAEGDAAFAPLFEARAAQLIEGRSRAWAEGWLSGYLIGREIQELAGAFGAPTRVQLVGDPALCDWYERALATRGIAAKRLDDARCTVAGLALLDPEVR